MRGVDYEAPNWGVITHAFSEQLTALYYSTAGRRAKQGD